MSPLSALAVTTISLALAPSAQASFGFRPGAEGFEMLARAEGGAPEALAGSHPYELSAKIALRTVEEPAQPGVPFSDGDLRDLRIELPPGLIEDPAALPRCSAADFDTPRSSPFESSRSGESCPAATQLGTVEVHSAQGGGPPRRFGVFDLQPPPGAPAELGFAPYGAPIALRARIREAEGGYGVSWEATNLTQALDIDGLDLTLWGVPWAASHDGERGACLNEAEPGFPWAKCSLGPPLAQRPLAYLTMPASCGAPLAFAARAESWQQPGEAVAESTSPPLRGCDALRFDPIPTAQLSDRKASSASGLQFDLTSEDGGLTDPGGLAVSQARRAVVTLPEGVTVNPSVGAGLGVCSPARYAAESATSTAGEGCPDAAKIGDFAVSTPLLENQLQGAVYLAQPYQNPFGALLALYLIARSPQRGIAVKVAGEVEADPATGRLTATFEDLPQLPYTDLEVNLRSGQRAPLVTPAPCGAARTAIELDPWAAGPAAVHATSASPIEAGSQGGPCPAGPQPFAPGALAGALNSAAGAYAPYFLHLTRKDTEQEITSYSMVLPRGITAKLAGIPFCPEAAIAAARAKSGEAELAHPSCPQASLIGHTLSGYGVGSALAYARGAVYLAGPYHGAPLSVLSVDPAVVGPFDLGTIVIRSGFEVDPATAQLRIDSGGSDPIPHILDGIPLRLRDVRVYMDRPEFTRNPTSCEPSQLLSTLTGAGARFGDPSDDSSATLAVPFQLLDCRALGFQPKLGLRLRGGSRRGAYPSLRATFAARRGDADLSRIAVTMPHAEFLAQNHIRAVCTRAQFAAGQGAGAQCPPGSAYGHAAAYTPLFDGPLEGPVFLRSSDNRLPDLVASLHWGAVDIVLDGRIGPAKHGIRAFFAGLPDAPIDRFVLTMDGGGRGLLVNSESICAAAPTASVEALAQNNLGALFSTRLRGQCAKRRPGQKGEHG
jgi:hypothetical protein